MVLRYKINDRDSTNEKNEHASTFSPNIIYTKYYVVHKAVGKGLGRKKKNYMYIYFGLGMQAEQRIQDAVLRI